MSADTDFCEDLCAAVQAGNLEFVRDSIEASSSYLAKQTLSYNSRKTSLLFLAAANGHENLVKYLVEIGADASIKCELETEECGTIKHAPAIFAAAYHGNLAIVQYLIETGKASIHSVAARRTSLLFVASYQLPVAKYLLEKGLFVDVWNRLEVTPLMFASAYGKVEAVELFLAHGADCKKYDRHGNTALHYASGRGYDFIVTMLLERGADVNAVNVYGKTPLFFACDGGCLSTVNLLIEKGANTAVASKKGFSLVMAASHTTKPEALGIAEKLLSKDVDVNHKDSVGSTALHVAAYVGNTELASFLINSGADVNAARSNGITPLYYASSEGHLDIVKLLIDKGADINAEGLKRRTPLMKALIEQRKDVVEYLLQKNADVRKRCAVEQTALHLAAVFGDADAADLIIKLGADVNAVSKNITPLLIACRFGWPRIVRSLVENGADVNYSDPKEYFATPLMFAAYHDLPEIAEYLLKHGADTEKINKYKGTALHVAAAKGNKSIVGLLLDYGANIDAASRLGTPLQRACYHGHLDIVRMLVSGDAMDGLMDEGDWFLQIEANHKLLLLGIKRLLKSIRMKMKGVKHAERKADVNSLDASGWTPLMFASAKGHIEVVRFLLKHGANLNRPNKRGETALMMARRKHHFNVCALLIQAGARESKNPRSVCQTIFSRLGRPGK